MDILNANPSLMHVLQGLTLGLTYVAPIGMQNMFVINAGLSRSRSKAYQTALLIIFFDVTLALACFFGMGALMEHSRLLRMGVLLTGSLMVVGIGVKLVLTRPRMDGTTAPPLSKVLVPACVVTWCNPQAIIDGTLMLGAFRAALPPEAASAFILGVATASCLWFLSLTTLILLFRHVFTALVLRIINVVCGVIIIAYGLKLGWSFLQLLQA